MSIFSREYFIQLWSRVVSLKETTIVYGKVFLCGETNKMWHSSAASVKKSSKVVVLAGIVWMPTVRTF